MDFQKMPSVWRKHMQLNDYNKLFIDMKNVVSALCTVTTEKNTPEMNLESIINLELDSPVRSKVRLS